MSFFKQPKPRRFHHETIYYDEHRDRVRQIEERARRELGMDAGTEKQANESGERLNPYGIRGTFTKGVRQKRASRGIGFMRILSLNTGAILIIILILLLVWVYLSR